MRQPDGVTDLRLQLLFHPRQSPCAHRDHEPPFERLLPKLKAPTGASQIPRGGGGGGASWYTSAAIESDLDRQAIGDHYDRQIAQAGWTRTGEGSDEQQAWSAWSFTDADGQAWQELFSIVKVPQTPRQHFLQLYIAWADDSAAGSGWESSVGIAWM
jgi:hypothetical protein